MMEYKTIECLTIYTEQYLNEYAEAGWRLVSILPGINQRHSLILERARRV